MSKQSDISCQVSFRKRLRPLIVPSRSTAIFLYDSSPTFTRFTELSSWPHVNPNLDPKVSELPSPKKLRPSRESAAEAGALKSAFKSPPRPPPVYIGSPHTDSEDDSGSQTLDMTSIYSCLMTPSPNNSPSVCRKNVRFTYQPEADTTSPVLLTVHLTHSPQSYDRSPINVDSSLRLPPRLLDKEITLSSPDEEHTDSVSESTRSLADKMLDPSWEPYNSTISNSVLDGF